MPSSSTQGKGGLLQRRSTLKKPTHLHIRAFTVQGPATALPRLALATDDRGTVASARTLPASAPSSPRLPLPEHLAQELLKKQKHKKIRASPPNSGMASGSSNGGLGTPVDQGSRMTQSTTSRMMKTTRRGRPFAKDTHDLFATLIVSLELSTHRQYLRTYPNSFTTDEAAENLSALKFSQSNRAPDPKEPSRVITTTTTTTFSMSREMAKGICQHFMDARLIENATDLSSIIFKERGIYVITPKGLHILERFITKNGINGEHLLKVFQSQPICMKLLHLERRPQDDELLINRGVLEVIFRRFVGRQPNYAQSENGEEAKVDLTLGVEMHDLTEKIKSSKEVRVKRHTFTAISALEWLCDYTTICGRDEAAEMAAHFVRLKYIELLQDRTRKENDSDGIVQVQTDDGGASGVTLGEFRCHYKAIYGLTDWGRTIARWQGYAVSNEQSQTASFQSRERPSSLAEGSHGLADDSRSTSSQQGIVGRGLPSSSYAGARPSQEGTNVSSSDLHRSPSPGSIVEDAGGMRAGGLRHQSSASDQLRGNFARSRQNSSGDEYGGGVQFRDSNTKRLRQILEEPALRSLFRDFLKQNFCEENLSFWLDVQDFKRRFHTTSSAVAVRGSDGGGGSNKSDSGKGSGSGSGVVNAVRKLGGKSHSQSNANEHSASGAMECHQKDLIAMAFVIYNTYLAPGSTCELNIEHTMRTELVTYMNKILNDARGGEGLNQVSAKDIHRSASDASGNLEERRKAVHASMPRAGLHASQLQTMVRMYERIQDHIFRLMATDSVPRFIKDPRFLSLVHSVEEYTEALEAGRIDPSINSGPGLGKSVVDALELDQGKQSSAAAAAEDEQLPDSDSIEALRDEPTSATSQQQLQQQQQQQRGSSRSSSASRHTKEGRY